MGDRLVTKIGVYAGNSIDNVKTFEKWLGREVDGVLGYTGRDNWKDFVESADWAAKLWSGIDRPVFWSVPLITNTGNLKSAANGDYNSYYRQVAEDLAATRKGDGEIHIRTGWEFDGGWFPWKAKGNEEAFIGAWRQFVDTFRSVSDRFVFEWTPNNGDMGMNPETAYPGDDYVDIIGMDFYYNTSWDSTDPEEAWDFMVNRPFGLQWHQDFAAAHGKKTSYSEWGVKTAEAGPLIENFAEWVAQHDVEFHTYWDSNADFPGKLSDNSKWGAGQEFKDEFKGESKAAVDGHSWDETLVGTSRGERLDGKEGADAMQGKSGDDAYYVDNAGDRVVEKAGEGKDEIRSTLSRTALSDNVEDLTLLSKGGQTGIGNDLGNRIVGGAGDDTLDGRGGDDWLMGGSGNDTFVVRPGTGRDTIADFKAGWGAGDRLLIESSAMDSFAKVKAALEQNGSDTLLSLPSGEVVVFKGLRVDQFVSDDFIFGGAPPAAPPAWNPSAPVLAPSAVQYSLTGGPGNDRVVGTGQNDSINGAGGADRMEGGKGHDTYVVDRPEDVIVEKKGEGIDTVLNWAKSNTLPDNVEHLKNLGSYAQTATGNGLANRLTGGSGADTVDGAGGDDWLTGGGGGDLFVFRKGTGHDVVTDMKAGSGGGDVVRLENYGWSSYSQVKGGLSQKGADTLLTLPGGDTVLFKDTRITAFNADDFVFGGSGTAPAAPPTGTPPASAPPEAGSSTIVVRAAADSWNGAPEFRLSVDGRTIGDDATVTTRHGSGWQEFTFKVAGDPSPDTIAIEFLNDAWGGTSWTDRNLSIDRISVNGRWHEAEWATYHREAGDGFLGASQMMTHNGTLVFDLDAAA